METKISPDFRKPFRGLTTIQLFDKNTGKLLEEYHDENTYNDRLQYINYLDTIIGCQGPNIASNVAPFTRLPRDYQADSYSSFFTQVLPYYQSMTDYSSSYERMVRQPFATLWLTNGTNAETAHGYPNGFPVGLADACGNNSRFNGYSCVGVFNTSESYVGKDRLHLVFDFATDRCNVQFDSLWLYPSRMRRAPSYDTNGYAYDVCPFFGRESIAMEVGDNLPTTYTYLTRAYKLNGEYFAVLFTSDNSRQDHYGGYQPYSPFYAISIYSEKTGEVVATYDWAKMNYTMSPVYYDAQTNTLYMLKVWYTNATYLLGSANDNASLYAVDMSTGTQTRVGYLYDLLGMTWADFNATTANSYVTLMPIYSEDGSFRLAFRIRVTDATTGSYAYYLVWHLFDAVTATFTKVSKVQLLSDLMNSSYFFMNDDVMYIPSAISTSQSDYNKFTAIDVKTGEVKSSNIVSTSAHGVLNNVLQSSATVSRYSGDVYMYTLQDIKHYRQATYWPYNSAGASTAGNKLYKYQYMTAFWTTHNKLTSPVTKTDMTTMKIQYDIVWDSVTDVILPALV